MKIIINYKCARGFVDISDSELESKILDFTKKTGIELAFDLGNGNLDFITKDDKYSSVTNGFYGYNLVFTNINGINKIGFMESLDYFVFEDIITREVLLTIKKETI